MLMMTDDSIPLGWLTCEYLEDMYSHAEEQQLSYIAR